MTRFNCSRQIIGKLSTNLVCVTGTISKWGEVKKKTKDRSVSKAKESTTTSTDISTSGARGGRGRGGSESARGGRGRSTDRGRGASRGARAAAAAASTNGPRSTKTDTSATVEPSWNTSGTELATQVTSGNWDLPASTAESIPLDSSWENVSAEAAQPSEPPKPASKPDGTRSWASMFAKPKPAPAPPKAPQAIPNHDAPPEAPIAATSNPISDEMQGFPPRVGVNDTCEIPNTPPTSDFTTSEVPPSGDELTETNLEQVPDTSGPAASVTAASTVASTMDPRNAGTPIGSAQQNQPGGRPPMGGFATSAWKATGQPGRSASFQRKVLEQQEAVVMPGKHAVDRATVQFGSMGLNGTPEDVDVDSDREDAETRAQPPQHSPVAPRASLPPMPQQQGFSAQPPATDSLPTPRQAPGLPPVGQSSAAQQQDQSLSGEQSSHSHPGPSSYPYNQLNDRYGTQAPSTQKPYEPFGQQSPQPSQSEGFPSSSQPGQPTSQSAFSSAGNDMSSFYTSDNQRNAYPNNFYGGYGQQTHQQGHDSARTGSAFGTSAPGQGTQYATNGQQHSQGRFGQASELQASGHSTPNPSMSSQQPPNQPHHMIGQQQGQGHAGGQYGGYPGGYGHPYGAGFYSSYMNQMNQVSNHPYGRERPLFDDVRRYDDQYLTQNPQYGYGGSQGGYSSGPFGGAGGKGGMYGQAHQGYGQSPYDQHSASPANSGAFGSQLPSSGRDNATTGGLGAYGRSSSAQPSDGPYSGSGASSHGNAPDPFGGRAQSGYQGHNQGLGSGMGQGGNEDSVRGYGGESKAPSGPNPALGQPGGRPGSTQGQSSSGPGGYSGYPGHMNQGMHGQQGSQYGSGPAHQSGGQNHQGSGYGAYGTGYGGNYYGSSNRGGWGAGASYGH